MKKIIGMFMCMLFLVLSVAVNIPEDKIVEAETSPTTYPIDYQYIKEIAKDLSYIINSTQIYPDGELAKGRFFGSKGEWDAADRIAIEMEELGLWDPTKNNDQNPPYRERIQNLDLNRFDRPFSQIMIYRFMSNRGKLREITEVLERGFNATKQNNTELVDCYISPKIYNVSSYPWWHKESLLQSKNKDFLTYNYSYNGLKIIKTDNYTCTDDFLCKANVTIYSHFTRYNITSENVKVFNNHQISTMLQLLRPLIRSHTFRSINPLQKAFEKHYNFKFRTMNTNKSSTWPDFLEEINGVDDGFVFIEECPLFNPNISELPSLEISDDYNEFYWWTRIVRTQYQELRMKAWAKVYPKCKGLIWYDYLNDSYDTGFTGTYLPIIYINNTIGWELYNNTDDYTVGFWMNQSLNETVESYNVIGQINGSDDKKTVIIGCLYDSMWCQGTTDSATGVGVMLAIAKYFDQNEITPKYNLRFVAYGAEEVGMRGALHYEYNHSNDIVAVIDLNQFGFKQPKHNTTFNIVTNDLDSVTKLDYISSLTNYIDRAPEDANVSELKTYSIPIGSLSDDWIFAFARIARPLQNRDLKTVLFLRDSNWYRHHRDGMNHTEGDSMKYFLDDDVNLTAELIWNVTKFYTVNPNCWFKAIDHELWDSPNDNNDVPDALNISFTIKTSIPSDRVRIKAYLQNNLHKERNISEYVISSDSEHSGYINFSLPADAPFGEYTLYVYLFNSTGTVKSNFYSVFDDAHHWVRDDIFANDTYKKLGIYIGGCNDLVNSINQPSSSTQNMKAGTSYSYTSSATEPNNEQVFYQFKWTSHSLEHEYSSWYGPYASGVNCTVPHIWTSAGNMEVRVRSRDKWFAPGGWSNWSDPLNITASSGCAIFTNSTTVLLNNQINFSGEKYDFDFSGPIPSWNWSFGNGNTSTTQNTSQTYNATGDYTVNLTLENDTSKVYYEIVVHVVNLSADFSVSQNSIQSNETLYFTDLSEGINTITNWTWDFGDGNNSYERNPNHVYAVDGEYNVSLNVTDGSNTSSHYKKIYVDSVSPNIVTVFYSTEHPQSRTTPTSYYPESIGYGCNVTINTDFFENLSKVDTVKLNVTTPDGDKWNLTMSQNKSFPHDYEYVFNDTWQIGDYLYHTWVVDEANNSNVSSDYLMIVEHLFGYTPSTSLNQSIEDRLSGSVFTVKANGTADNVTAFIQTNLSTPPKTKCMIYRLNDSSLIGTTEELTPNTGDDPNWVVFNFSEPKPSLIIDTEYVLAGWSNDTCYLYYDNVSSDLGRYNGSLSYGASPNPVNWSGNETRLYSIYCKYTTTPEISNVSYSPTGLGLGSNVTISSDINSFGVDMDIVIVNITNPDNFSWNYTMEDVGNNTYSYIFNENWLVGQYNFSIWAFDEVGSSGNTTGHSYNVSSNATISICTIKDEYGYNKTINLTDPPGNQPLIGHELIDGGDVLHIWNKYDSYYFDTDSGIQLTNHYNEYWSHNVLMLGYYNNDQWNLMYRTDELSGFNKDIDSDNETFVNATLWKDLTYGGYDFRLAIRYCLGVDDNELTVIPYIKNIDQSDIPYILGFGWEMKDIQIDMTETGDYIDVNGTMYYLNQTLNNTYTDLSASEFYLMENITETHTKSLYLKWNESLTYKLQVKSRTGQYNAPVTLFIRIGTLNSGQEKYTKMYWYDADQKIYYFNSYDNTEAWTTNPSYMVDGNTNNYASTTTNGDIELCNGNNCSGSDIGGISMVEIRVCVYYSGDRRNIYLRPVFNGTTDGFNYYYEPRTDSGTWSSWFDITNDLYAPNSWTWTDVDNLDCDVEVIDNPMGMPFTMYCSQVEIRVTYNPYSPPEISNPVPSDGSTGISLTPTLNITISDVDNDTMNIVWSSNSSGSWQVFGTNTSVSNGTYYQTFSNATENGKWWYWKVNVTDGMYYNESNVFKFYTGYQSKIENTGSTNISGYLCIQIHFYNSTSQNWTIIGDPVNETDLRTINAGEQLGLDTIFNGLVNTNDLSDIGNGTYRVYVALRDLIYNVLVTDDDAELEATYEFTITFE